MSTPTLNPETLLGNRPLGATPPVIAIPPPTLRYRLIRDVRECDLLAGSIGTIVAERSGDDREFVLVFDARPGLRVTFSEAEFCADSPQYILERAP